MRADFTPSMGSYHKQNAFKYWVQKVLPLVYDDSLSYYELLEKVVVYLNNAIEDVNQVIEDTEALHEAYVQLQGWANDFADNLTTDWETFQTQVRTEWSEYKSYVTNYLTNLDVQEEINNKLDVMAEDGTLTELFRPFLEGAVTTQNQRISVLESRMNTFASLPDGSLSTSADAELVDIRVGADGTVYPTAGDAVRGQINGLNNVLDISSASVTATGSGNNYVTYTITAGKKYTFRVESSANCSIATVDASNQTVETVGILMNGNSLVFTATQDAPKVLFYFRASGTGYITAENTIDIIENKIAELSDKVTDTSGHINATVSASESGNQYVTYEIKAGKKYNFRVDSSANCSISTVSDSNQVIENVGILMNDNSLVFTATQDAPKVVFFFRASGTGYITSVNAIDNLESQITELSDSITGLSDTKYSKQWVGKTWSNYGDSISWTYEWHSYVNNLLGFVGFVRNGKPGAKISWANTMFGIDANGIYTTGTPVKTVHESMCSYDRIIETLDNTLPLIFVMGGTNDFLGNVPLGDLTFNSEDATDSAWNTANPVGDYDINTFKGAMASMLMKLQYHAPNSLIVFGTLMNGVGATAGSNQYAEQVNSVGLKPSDYANAEKEVCELFGVPYIDVFANCGINITNRATYISDTVHPNAQGMKLLARCIASGLMKEFLRLE